MTKRIRGKKYDLIEDFIKIQQELQKGGEHLATLEFYEDYKAVRKFKRIVWDIQEKLRIFVKEKIEPIRLEISHGVQQVQQEEEGLD